MGRHPIPVLNSLPVTIIVGVILGFLSGLGIGGGSLLILWLTLVLDMDQSVARSINLLFFIPSALSSSLLRIRGEHAPDWKIVIPAAATGCCAAVLLSLLSRSIDTFLLKKLFGVLLLAAGLRELFYRPRKQ